MGMVLIQFSVASGFVLARVSNEHSAVTKWGLGDGDKVRDKA